MPYTQEISRQNKACFLFLVDQSFSMVEPLGGSDKRKCDELVDAINGWLSNMTIRAAGGGGVRDWMDIGVIGYRTDQQNNPIVEPSMQGELAGKNLVSITEIEKHPARIQDKEQLMPDPATGEVIPINVQVPVWVDPAAEGGTPMCHAFLKAHEVLSQWISEHPKSFPPVVIHITDGESADGDPIPYAESLKELSTDDGNVLLFNCHLSMVAKDSFMFINNGELLPDDYARTLFEMSSKLPDSIVQRANTEGMNLQGNARGMVFNADMVCLIKFLDMGTRVALR